MKLFCCKSNKTDNTTTHQIIKQTCSTTHFRKNDRYCYHAIVSIYFKRAYFKYVSNLTDQKVQLTSLTEQSIYSMLMVPLVHIIHKL